MVVLSNVAPLMLPTTDHGIGVIVTPGGGGGSGLRCGACTEHVALTCTGVVTAVSTAAVDGAVGRTTEDALRSQPGGKYMGGSGESVRRRNHVQVSRY